jgi:hypothetical protein
MNWHAPLQPLGCMFAGGVTLLQSTQPTPQCEGSLDVLYGQPFAELPPHALHGAWQE